MDIKQIQYFMEVNHTGSFTAAAKRLYLSVPGLVKSMDRLEDELGSALFVRTRSGVTLTPAGQALVRHAPAYIREHELLVSDVRRAAAQHEKCVEVGMTSGLLSFFPRNFLSRYVLCHPDTLLNAHNYSLKKLQQALLEYRETIGLYFGEIDTADLEVLFHREAPLCALMAADHPLYQRESIRLKDLTRQKIVLVNSESDVLGRLQARLEGEGCQPQIMLDGANWEQAMELVTNAGYISFCLAPRNKSSMILHTRSVEDLDLTVKFNMVVRKGVVMTDAERCFVDYVLELMKAHDELD